MVKSNTSYPAALTNSWPHIAYFLSRATRGSRWCDVTGHAPARTSSVSGTFHVVYTVWGGTGKKSRKETKGITNKLQTHYSTSFEWVKTGGGLTLCLWNLCTRRAKVAVGTEQKQKIRNILMYFIDWLYISSLSCYIQFEHCGHNLFRVRFEPLSRCSWSHRNRPKGRFFVFKLQTKMQLFLSWSNSSSHISPHLAIQAACDRPWTHTRTHTHSPNTHRGVTHTSEQTLWWGTGQPCPWWVCHTGRCVHSSVCWECFFVLGFMCTGEGGST